jgi:phosphoglycerate dehydrogenase-like enzyme
LIHALETGRIAGAGLDVFWEEPLPPTHPLCALSNVVMTPHLGYATGQNLTAFYRDVVHNIRLWLEGGEPRLLT